MPAQAASGIAQVAGDSELVKAAIGAIAIIVAALIAAVIGTIGASIIANRRFRARDLQDRESEWRSHAIEITKLDVERRMEAWKLNPKQPVLPFILTFLANYRDLQELDRYSPRDLYLKIKRDRITDKGNAKAKSVDSFHGIVACEGDIRGRHPMVYLAIQQNRESECPYCGKRYKLGPRISEDTLVKWARTDKSDIIEVVQ